MAVKDQVLGRERTSAAVMAVKVQVRGWDSTSA